ncbi:MAG: Fic family protein [Alphaproteobacteria bacterium]|nr:Fic family protein [Alphaproteobacteria bacterium]
MDASLFEQTRTGRLIPISIPVHDVAFLPDPLPQHFVLPVHLWPLLVEARAELARLDGAGRHLSNPELLLTPLKRREALKSSSIEGTFATAEQLLLYEASGGAAAPRSGAEVREVFNYSAALELGLALLAELPFCLRLIREMHGRLMQGVRGGNKAPGQLRRVQVHLGLDRRYVPPPPDVLQVCLGDFERDMHAEIPIDPLIWSYMLHYQFEAIHPFSDGNGRVGRLLLALLIGERCGLQRPWLYMSPWFDQHKSEYVDRMFAVSARGDWEPWLGFCLRGTIAQARDALRRLEDLIALRARYRDALARSGGSIRLHRIVDELFDLAPVARVASLAHTLDVTYPTAKADLDRLVELGILAEVDGAYPKTFFAPEIIRVGIGS